MGVSVANNSSLKSDTVAESLASGACHRRPVRSGLDHARRATPTLSTRRDLSRGSQPNLAPSKQVPAAGQRRGMGHSGVVNPVPGIPPSPFVLLPAVDVAGGQAVRRVQGEAGSETTYGRPLDAALAWQAGCAKWVHLVDPRSDAARIASIIGTSSATATAIRLRAASPGSMRRFGTTSPPVPSLLRASNMPCASRTSSTTSKLQLPAAGASPRPPIGRKYRPRPPADSGASHQRGATPRWNGAIPPPVSAVLHTWTIERTVGRWPGDCRVPVCS